MTLATAIWLLGRLLAGLFLTTTVWVLGSLVIARLAVREDERLPLELAAGLAGWGHLLWLLAGAALFEPWPVAAVVVAVHVAARKHWRRVLQRFRGPIPRRPSPIAVAALVLVAPAVVLPLYPPTEFDALVYHLPYAEGFVETGTMPFFETLLFPLFPAHQELLFGGMMLFGTDSDAQLVSLLTFVATALLVWTWGRRSGSPFTAAVAAGLWIGTPLVLWHAGTAYVDLALALFAAATLYALQRSRVEPGTGWAALAAFFAVSAAAVKILGLFFVGWVGLVLLVPALRRTPARRSAAAAIAILFVGTGAWYGRTAAMTGNPLFPFYPELFGSSPWSPPSGDKGAEASLPVTTVLTVVEGLDEIVLLPWDMVMRRGRYHDQAPFNPWLLVLIPVGIGPALARREQRRLLVPVALFLLAWTVTTREPRFALAVLPPLAVTLGCGLERLAGRRLPRHPALPAVLLAAIAAPGTLYGMVKVVAHGPPPATPAARESFLQRGLPGYGAVSWLNGRFGSEYVAIAWQSPWLTHHARGTVLGTAFGAYSPQSIFQLARRTPDRLVALQSLGVEWVIEAHDWYGERRRVPSGIRAELEPVARGGGWTVYRIPPRSERVLHPVDPRDARPLVVVPPAGKSSW